MIHPEVLASIAIIGTGRMGKGLGLALTRRGLESVVLGRDWDTAAVHRASLVLLAVPDDAITPLAAELAARRAIHRNQVVLHLSGAQDRSALAPLDSAGAGCGSFHPLQSVDTPETAPERLDGAYAAIEGDERAITAGEALAEALGMKAVQLPADAKPRYHAAATFVSNYTVVLAAIAERLAESAGIAPDVAKQMYIPLLQGTVANIARSGVSVALTGPARRGDAGTIQKHLETLSPTDRSLYRALAVAAIELARQTDDPKKTETLTALLAAPE